jgi:hypothetical protein
MQKSQFVWTTFEKPLVAFKSTVASGKKTARHTKPRHTEHAKTPIFDLPKKPDLSQLF